MKPLFELQDAFKTGESDQDKVIPPAETVRRFRERLKTVDLDIMTETVRIDTGRLDIPVYMSICGKDAHALTQTTKQMGKGATPAQAEASAVMELAERFSLYAFANSPSRFIDACYVDVKTAAVPFPLIAASVNDDPSAENRRVFETLNLRWTESANITRNTGMMIPFDWFFAINEFNGSAAGNLREEAVCQGICEVVERHVSERVSRKRIPPPAVNPDSAADPATKRLLAKYRKAGVLLYPGDFTLDTGISTVGVVAYDPVTFPHRSEIVWTAGTAPSPEKSFLRALTEIAQLAGDFNTTTGYVASGLPKFSSLADLEYLLAGHRSERGRALSTLPDLSHSNIRVEIERLTKVLANQDYDILVVDAAHPALQIPVVYTIIPGTRFRERAQNACIGMIAAKLAAERFSPPAALSELRRIEDILPRRYYVRFYMGAVHLAMGEIPAAISHFERALSLDPAGQDIPSIYAYIGSCHMQTEAFEKALRAFSRGLDFDSERTDLYNLKGYCYFKLGKNEAAIESFQQVIQRNPASAIDYANIASNYRDMGDTESAVAYYKKALAIDPTIDFARENLRRLST